MSFWYPAEPPVVGPRLSFRDYFLLTAAELTLAPVGPGEADTAVARFKAFLASNGIADDVVDDWFSRTGAAVRGATAAPTTNGFPLILIAQGNFHAAYNQAILAEYLASHGYTVATTPSQSRISGPPPEGAAVIDLAREQAADLELVLRTLARDPRVDIERVGVVAHSFGARSALLLLHNHAVAALVSLDGGIANRQGKDWLDGAAFDARSVRTPILHFYQEVDPIVQPDFDLLTSFAASERMLIRVDSLYHPHFTSLGVLSGLIPNLNVGPSSPEVLAKSLAIAEVTLRFLDAYVRRNRARPTAEDVSAVSPALSARPLPAKP